MYSGETCLIKPSVQSFLTISYPSNYVYFYILYPMSSCLFCHNICPPLPVVLDKFLLYFLSVIGVQSAAVNVICELARKNPQNYLSLAPLFFKLMTSSSNNWVLIKIIKLVSSHNILHFIPFQFSHHE